MAPSLNELAKSLDISSSGMVGQEVYVDPNKITRPKVHANSGPHSVISVDEKNHIISDQSEKHFLTVPNGLDIYEPISK